MLFCTFSGVGVQDDKRKVEREKRKENTLTADNFLLNKSFILVIICKL